MKQSDEIYETVAATSMTNEIRKTKKVKKKKIV